MQNVFQYFLIFSCIAILYCNNSIEHLVIGYALPLVIEGSFIPNGLNPLNRIQKLVTSQKSQLVK
jgi:hypothetical protein